MIGVLERIEIKDLVDGNQYMISDRMGNTYRGVAITDGCTPYFVIKDSIRLFATDVDIIQEILFSVKDEPNADRKNQGKAQLSYILDAPIAMKGLSEVFAMGAEKYARDNWKKGLDKDEIIDSLLRHLIAYKNGELVDEGSGKCHTHHIHWNALVLAEQHSNK